MKLVFVYLKHNTNLPGEEYNRVQQNTTNVLLVTGPLAAVGDGDGELLVAVGAVCPHTADDVDHPLLLRRRPGERSVHRLRVGGDAGEVVLGGHRHHIVVGLPDEVNNITWGHAHLVLRHAVDPINVHGGGPDRLDGGNSKHGEDQSELHLERTEKC